MEVASGSPNGSQFEDVLRAARAGERKAFDALFTMLSGRVATFARTHGAADADDVVSDVFLKVFIGLDQFSGNEAQFKAWVFRIARNTLIDAARKRATRPVEKLVHLTPAQTSPDNPEVIVLGQLELGALHSHLDDLTPDQRDVVLLRVVEDLTVSSTAARLGKKPDSVRALQRRAIASLERSVQSGRRRDVGTSPAA